MSQQQSALRSFGALPLLMLSGRIEWTEDRVQILRAVFVVAITGCVAVLRYLRAACDKEKDGRGAQEVFVPPEPQPSLMPKPPEPVEDNQRVRTTYFEHESGKLDRLRQQVLVGALIALGVHFYFEINPPLLLQAFMLPMSLFESPSFKARILGAEFEGIWDEKTRSAMSALPSPETQQPAGDSASASSGSGAAAKKNQGKADKASSTASKASPKQQMESAIQQVWDDGKAASYGELVSLAKRDGGALVNHRTEKDGYSALMVACGNPESYKATAAVRELLETGARVLDGDSDGWTAVHWCCFHANLNALRALAEHARAKGVLKELVTKADSSGVTPLAMARDEAAKTGEAGKAVVKELEKLEAEVQ